MLIDRNKKECDWHLEGVLSGENPG